MSVHRPLRLSRSSCVPAAVARAASPVLIIGEGGGGAALHDAAPPDHAVRRQLRALMWHAGVLGSATVLLLPLTVPGGVDGALPQAAAAALDAVSGILCGSSEVPGLLSRNERAIVVEAMRAQSQLAVASLGVATGVSAHGDNGDSGALWARFLARLHGNAHVVITLTVAGPVAGEAALRAVRRQCPAIADASTALWVDSWAGAAAAEVAQRVLTAAAADGDGGWRSTTATLAALAGRREQPAPPPRVPHVLGSNENAPAMLPPPPPPLHELEGAADAADAWAAAGAQACAAAHAVAAATAYRLVGTAADGERTASVLAPPSALLLLLAAFRELAAERSDALAAVAARLAAGLASLDAGAHHAAALRTALTQRAASAAACDSSAEAALAALIVEQRSYAELRAEAGAAAAMAAAPTSEHAGAAAASAAAVRLAAACAAASQRVDALTAEHTRIVSQRSEEQLAASEVRRQLDAAASALTRLASAGRNWAMRAAQVAAARAAVAGDALLAACCLETRRTLARWSTLESSAFMTSVSAETEWRRTLVDEAFGLLTASLSFTSCRRVSARVLS